MSFLKHLFKGSRMNIGRSLERPDSYKPRPTRCNFVYGCTCQNFQSAEAVHDLVRDMRHIYRVAKRHDTGERQYKATDWDYVISVCEKFESRKGEE